MATNAEHQAAHRRRVKDLIERLQAENRQLRSAARHEACDARIAELAAQVEHWQAVATNRTRASAS